MYIICVCLCLAVVVECVSVSVLIVFFFVEMFVKFGAILRFLTRALLLYVYTESLTIIILSSLVVPVTLT